MLACAGVLFELSARAMSEVPVWRNSLILHCYSRIGMPTKKAVQRHRAAYTNAYTNQYPIRRRHKGGANLEVSTMQKSSLKAMAFQSRRQRKVASMASATCLFGTILWSSAAHAATSVSRHGITWSFAADYTVGTFANGDYWVHNNGSNVIITSMTPGSTNDGGWIKNGAQVNPAHSSSQGYDNSIDYMSYDSQKNVDPGITGNNLVCPPGTSVVKSISRSTTGNRPQLSDAAVLTVLASSPTPGSFRPANVGTDKTIFGTRDDLDYGILLNLSAPASVPDLTRVTDQFERVWMEQNSSWTGRYIHPANNQPDYGRDMADELGDGLLMLNLDFTRAQKELLYIRLVQYGIDVWGAANAGAVWDDNGGHNMGRKMPLLLAAKALDNPTLLGFADASQHLIFQEDRQTWYVTQYDVGRPLYHDDGRPREEYVQEDVGIPEWGEKHTSNESRDGRNWSAFYRQTAGCAFFSHALTAEMMGFTSDWNHDVLFDYIDRYYIIESPGADGSANHLTPFEVDMYACYVGGNCGAPPPPPPPPTCQNQGYTCCDACSSGPQPGYDSDCSGQVCCGACEGDSCLSSGSSWSQYQPFTAQTGVLTAEWDDQPNCVAADCTTDPLNAQTGLSHAAATEYADMSAIVRFNPSGFIDAYDGTAGLYSAARHVPYEHGVTCHFRLEVDIPNRSYRVFVAPATGSETELCASQTSPCDAFGFRAPATSLNVVNAHIDASSSGSHSVCNLSITASAATCQDNDGDGYGEPATSCSHTEADCNDGDSMVHPGATESCNDVDDDCDGVVDEGCDDGTDPVEVPVTTQGCSGAEGQTGSAAWMALAMWLIARRRRTISS